MTAAGDVSRETPSVPEAARRVFSAARLPVAMRFVELLATTGVQRGLIGPHEVPRLWERHILNCAVVAEAIPLAATVADLGSGAGLPGVVLAITRPDLAVTLVEPLLRRTGFLDEVVAELALNATTVVRGRAEQLHGTSRFDVVTARAVAPLSRLLGWAMPLVAPRGCLLAMKGRSAGAEIEEAADELRRLRCAVPEVMVLGDGTQECTATVVGVAHADPSQVS